MKSYKAIVLILFVIFLAGAAVAKNFNFLKNITASVFVVSQQKNPENKHLAISPQFGVYSTIWSVRSKRINDLIRLADETEINAIVIDVKDSGSYIDDNLKKLVNELHEKNIYTIARIVVFQDSSQVKIHPDWYFKKPASSAGRENGVLWQDNRKWYWLNPANNETWDYNLEISKMAIDAGFDELNFDYIRFPAFAKTDDVLISPDSVFVAKNKIINDFAAYLTSELKKYDPEIKLSVDLFAYNMLTKGDLGIGQAFIELYDYFDYVSPMIYPSHYISGNFGFDNPAKHPYEVVLGTIEKGKNQLWDKSVLEVGTTTPAIVGPVYNARLKKLRPWLQDFNMGAIYNGEMIRKEKQAVYDSGLTSGWLLWNASNIYTESALDK